MKEIPTNNGECVFDMSKRTNVMLVFLRHFGCPFCKETLNDLSKDRNKIEKYGTNIVLVHMLPEELAERILKLYGLERVSHIGDPNMELYHHFGLKKAKYSQLLCLKSIFRAFKAIVINGHLTGKPLGCCYQLPGVFVLSEGEVKKSFVHRTPADRPNYINLLEPVS
ncbi:MAG: SelL-related redox protein [Flavobacteriales bacterium]